MTTPMDLEALELEHLAHRALQKWGQVAQVRQASEECLELALAVRHLERGKAEVFDVAVEVADVEMVLEQLRQIIPGEMMAKARKQQRAKLAAALGAPS